MRTTQEQTRRPLTASQKAVKLDELREKYHIVKVQNYTNGFYDAESVKADAGFEVVCDDPQITGSSDVKLWGIPRDQWEQMEKERTERDNAYDSGSLSDALPLNGTVRQFQNEVGTASAIKGLQVAVDDLAQNTKRQTQESSAVVEALRALQEEAKK
jgi:hypothetical protein